MLYIKPNMEWSGQPETTDIFCGGVSTHMHEQYFSIVSPWSVQTQLSLYINPCLFANDFHPWCCISEFINQKESHITIAVHISSSIYLDLGFFIEVFYFKLRIYMLFLDRNTNRLHRWVRNLLYSCTPDSSSGKKSRLSGGENPKEQTSRNICLKTNKLAVEGEQPLYIERD